LCLSSRPYAQRGPGILVKTEYINFYAYTRVAAMSVMLLGVIVIYGWHTGNAGLVQIHSAFAPMQYNTALAFILSGLALLLCMAGRISPGIVYALLVILIGVLTLLQYLFGLDFGIDELFMDHYISVQTSTPGRMAPNTALCFTLSGLTLLLAARPNGYRSSSLMTGVLSSSVLGLATIALLGYLFDIQLAYAWGRYTNMALHTSIGFILLSTAMIARELSAVIDWNRHWWPVSISFAFITVSVALAHALDKDLELKQIITASNQFNPMSLVILLFGISMGIIIFVVLRIMQNANLRVTELHKLSDQLTLLSNTDHLTQLHNRRSIDRILQDEIVRARRFGRDLGLILIDLDLFKSVNDARGHQMGDKVLTLVGDLLKRRSRSIDIVGRYGGEEFTIICPETGVEGAMELAENLRRDMERTNFEAAGRLTFSAGLAALQPDEDIQSLISRADAALYRAKTTGRNRVVAA